MAEIGIRKLKSQASRILEEVRTHGARFVITKRGRPVGVILPIEEAPQSADRADALSAWDELDRLGEEISRGWKSSKTSGELLSDLRR